MVYFGLSDKSLGCPGYRRRETLEKIEKSLQKNKKLPSPCNECYTVIIWVAEKEENIAQFVEMLRDNYYQQINKNRKYQRVYIRIKDGERREEFIQELKGKLDEYGIEGKVDWRRCCKWIEEKLPYLFKNPKEFSEGIQIKMF